MFSFCAWLGYFIVFMFSDRYTDAIQVLSYIYDTHPTSRAALSLLAYCYFYTQVNKLPI